MEVLTTGPWEDRLLLDYGIVLDPVTEEWRGLAKPHQAGFAAVHPLDGGTRWYFAVKPELEPAARDLFAQWCWQHVERFLEHGPGPDGWQLRSDGGWQLWAGVREMPEV